MEAAKMGAASGTDGTGHELGGSGRRQRNPPLPGLSTVEVAGDLDENCFGGVKEGAQVTARTFQGWHSSP